ncbi:MAG: DUF72 domain-containing protein [Fibrobacteria bacterium]
MGGGKLAAERTGWELNRKGFRFPIRIGCAGWALDKALQPRFPEGGTHLQRYAAVFPSVEINSSFYRPHKRATYERWSASVPEWFRFCVKVPREITHLRRLKDCGDIWARFLDEVSGLGGKLGPLLVQLPPSLARNPHTAGTFLEDLRRRHDGPVALEPRHATWFTEAADVSLERIRIARVAADPALTPTAAVPGGWRGLAYYRLHGTPRMYYSPYPEARLKESAVRLKLDAESAESYCIFDNTAEGHAIPDAMALMEHAGAGGTGGTQASGAAAGPENRITVFSG